MKPPPPQLINEDSAVAMVITKSLSKLWLMSIMKWTTIISLCFIFVGKLSLKLSSNTISLTFLGIPMEANCETIYHPHNNIWYDI